MLKIHGKTVEHKAKIKRFPDETLETKNGMMRIDRYIKAASSSLLNTNCKNMSIKEIEKLFVESNILPETIIYKISKYVVNAAQRHTKGKRKLQLMELRIQK